MIEREWRSDVSASGERDEANAVIWPLRDELLHGVLRDEKPVHALAIHDEVFRLHATRKVDCDDDVDAARAYAGFAFGFLRTSQCEDEERQRDPSHRHHKCPSA